MNGLRHRDRWLDRVPASVRPFLRDATITDSSGDSSRMYRIDGPVRGFLKIGAAGSLERERTMTAFLHEKGMAPRVLVHATGEEADYLLTEALPGEPGSAPAHLAQPERLAEVFGERLRMLHALSPSGCPLPGVMPEAWNEPTERPVIIHGDYCLPNILLDRFRFTGFVDLGGAGLGDRHYDLFWGLWTLHYNLKTDAHDGRFLDAYGRDNIDSGRLRRLARFMKETGRAALEPIP